MTIEEKRYKDLKDYFSDEKYAKVILENDDEFKKWLERLKWHVKKCDELARELQAHREAWAKLHNAVENMAYMDADKTLFGQCYCEGGSKALRLIEKYRPKEGDAE